MQSLTIAGRVGKDAVLRTVQSGDQVLGFSLACNNGRDANGVERPATWYSCSLWGKRAPALAPHIRKAQFLVLRGRPTASVYEGKASLGINVDELEFGGGPRAEGGATASPGDAGGYGARSGLDDEIPFAPEVR